MRVFLIILMCLLLPFFLLVRYVRYDMENTLRGEISERIVQNFSKSTTEVEHIFTRMASISTILYSDEDLVSVFADESSSDYDRKQAYNRVLRQIYSQDLYEYTSEYSAGINVMLRDNEGKLFMSWSAADADSLQRMWEAPFVENCHKKPGFIFWDMDAPPFVLADGSEHRQIALARAIVDLSVFNRSYGTMIITVDQDRIYQILNEYRYCDEDIVFATLGSGGVLFADEQDQKQLLALPLDKVTQTGPVLVQLGDKPYLLSTYRIRRISIINSENLDVYYLTDYAQISDRIARLNNSVTLVSTLCLCLIACVSIWIAQLITKPMRRLAAHMNRYRASEAPLPLVTDRVDEVGEIYRAYNRISAENYELLKTLREEKGIREKYYLESLRSKMSPHFLFNTLTSIRWMAIIRNALNIRNSIDALAAILRYSLSDDAEYVRLSRELEVVENYCYIQEMRFGENCRLDIRVPDDVRRLYVIKFIVQPVVENCFKHAFRDAEGSGQITIETRQEGDILYLTIRDNGQGFPAEMIETFNRLERRAQKADHLGIHIVDERIRISYGDEYGLRLENAPDGGACVIYRLPVRQEEEI